MSANAQHKKQLVDLANKHKFSDPFAQRFYCVCIIARSAPIRRELRILTLHRHVADREHEKLKRAMEETDMFCSALPDIVNIVGWHSVIVEFANFLCRRQHGLETQWTHFQEKLHVENRLQACIDECKELLRVVQQNGLYDMASDATEAVNRLAKDVAHISDAVAFDFSLQ